MAVGFERERLRVVADLLGEAFLVAESIDDTLLVAQLADVIASVDRRLAPPIPPNAIRV